MSDQLFHAPAATTSRHPDAIGQHGGATGHLMLANVCSHARRYTATGIAVAICVAFVAACLAFSSGMWGYIAATARNDYAGAAAVVTVERGNESEFDGDFASLLPAIKQAEGVTATAPVSVTYLEVKAGTHTAHALVDPVRTAPFLTPALAEGSLPSSTSETVISEGLAQSLGVGVGDAITLPDIVVDAASGQTQDQSLRITGLSRDTAFAFPTVSLTQAGYTDLFPDASMQGILVAGSSSSPSQQHFIADAVAGAIGDVPGIAVLTHDEAVDLTLKDLFGQQKAMNTLLGIFPAIAVLVGCIVVATTFQVTFHQRRRELALLRTLGARRSQVRRIVLAEAALVGALAALVGVALGLPGGAWAVSALGLANSMGDALQDLDITNVLLTWVGAVVLTLLVGLRPALSASRVSPMVALVPQDADVKVVRRHRRLWLAVGTLLVIVALCLLALARWGSDESMSRFLLTAAGCCVLLMGTIALCVVILPRLIRALARPFTGAVATMARENTGRHPGRTAATATAMMIGVALVTSMIVGAASAQQTVISMVDARKPFDLMVVSEQGAIGQDVINRITSLPSVEASVVERSSIVQVTHADHLPFNDPDLNSTARLIGEPSLDSVTHSHVDSPADGVAFVHPASAWALESEIRVCTEGGSCQTLHTKALDRIAEGSIVVSDGALGTLAPESDVTQMVIRLAPGSDAQRAQSDIEASGTDLLVGGSALQRQQYMTIIDNMLLAVLGLLAAAVLVAIVGVTNTLSLSVAERTRETGLLRALGLTRRQTQRMLVEEALFIAVTASAIGIALGTILGWLGTLGLPFEEIPAYHLAFPWLRITGVLALTVVAAVLASWWPSRRASRISPTQALATE